MSGVLIFGGSGGIGRSVARYLAKRDIPFCLAARNEAALIAASQEVGAAGYVVADTTDLQQVEQAFSSATAILGAVKGVAHCVGSIVLKPAHLTSEAEFMNVVSVNLTSAFLVVRTAARTMTEGGSVVLFSSAAARVGLANHEAIAAAKGGVIGLTLSAAATYAARGLRFNCIAPGLVETALSEKITSNPSAAAFSTALHPLGRLGQPNDIGALAGLLLSDDAGWITGQVLGIDGGLATIKTRA
ncbi:MAG: SDR family NAD(P)-dependent oxidoreductase [Pseudomonadota bacterium]|jgi:3-oxoacyl-[acyl-carrier protein] reductase